MENKSFLTEQIITYLGNKRKLISFIGDSVAEILKKENKEKCSIFDGFSGSGVVSRYLKQFSSDLYVNDFEKYSYCVNSCYLENISNVDLKYLEEINKELNENKLKNLDGGIIRKLYSPINDSDIKEKDRAFYTNQNALIIDNIRIMISELPEKMQKYFLSPLLYEASVHVNTSGVFKGFYKDKNTGIGKFGGTGENALSRITGEINLPIPIFSNYECNVNIFNEDTNTLIKKLPEVDITYYDPPYNEHPYGSNYFMLNLIHDYEEPKVISKVSGIPNDWKKSDYYKKNLAYNAMDDLIKNTKSKYILISYSDEGILSPNDLNDIFTKYGKVEIKSQRYNTFRGSKNLNNRETYVDEFLYIIKKG